MPIANVHCGPLLLVFAILVLPGAAAAQSGTSLSDPDTATPPALAAPVPAPVPPLPGEQETEAPEPIAPQDPDDASDEGGPSFGASFAHAAGGFGIGAAIGAGLGLAITATTTCPEDSRECFEHFTLGTALGMAAATPLGPALAVWAFGQAQGGTGNLFATVGGAYLGAGIGIGAGMLIAGAGGESVAVTLGPVLGALMAMLGATVGYQLSSLDSDEDAEPEAVSVLPTLSIDVEGVAAGVTGSF